MKIAQGSRHQYGRCAFFCDDEEVIEINFIGVKVRLCKDHVRYMAHTLLSVVDAPIAPVKDQNERM
jgi:hypothetical protein